MKKIIGIGIILIAIAAGYGWYLYNKPHQGIADVEPTASLSSEELYNAYDQNEEKANSLYLGKVIDINGVIEEISMDTTGVTTLILKTGGLGAVSCRLDKSEKEKSALLSRDKKIDLKGKCSGKLIDVVLTDCILLKN